MIVMGDLPANSNRGASAAAFGPQRARFCSADADRVAVLSRRYATAIFSPAIHAGTMRA